MTNTITQLRVLTLLLFIVMWCTRVEGALWCVARSDASDAELQSGLDYACASGADCTPLLQSGLCFLPNTLQAHASYAYNSFFQRNNMVSGACDFSSTATLAKTDPSYGSCVYPNSPSTAGSVTSTTGTRPTTNQFGQAPPYGTTPSFGTPFTPPTSSGIIGGGSGDNPNMGPPIPTTSDSRTTPGPSIARTLVQMLILLLCSLAAF